MMIRSRKIYCLTTTSFLHFQHSHLKKSSLSFFVVYRWANHQLKNDLFFEKQKLKNLHSLSLDMIKFDCTEKEKSI